MDFYDWFGLFMTFGVVTMALSIFVTWRIANELRRQRVMRLHIEERLAAYRHAVEVEAERSAT